MKVRQSGLRGWPYFKHSTETFFWLLL